MAITDPELDRRFLETFEDVYGIPRGSIAKDPHAAAILACPPTPVEAALLTSLKEREREREA